MIQTSVGIYLWCFDPNKLRKNEEKENRKEEKNKVWNLDREDLEMEKNRKTVK